MADRLHSNTLPAALPAMQKVEDTHRRSSTAQIRGDRCHCPVPIQAEHRTLQIDNAQIRIARATRASLDTARAVAEARPTSSVAPARVQARTRDRVPVKPGGSQPAASTPDAAAVERTPHCHHRATRRRCDEPGRPGRDILHRRKAQSIPSQRMECRAPSRAARSVLARRLPTAPLRSRTHCYRPASGRRLLSLESVEPAAFLAVSVAGR